MAGYSYRDGFASACAAAGVSPSAVVKAAGISWGDVLNAGLGSMTMGSALAPRPFVSGVGGGPKLRPTAEIQGDMSRTALGGTIGLGSALGWPYLPAVGKFVGASAAGSVPFLGYEVVKDIANPQPTADDYRAWTEDAAARKAEEMLSPFVTEMSGPAEAGSSGGSSYARGVIDRIMSGIRSAASAAGRHPALAATAVGVPALAALAYYVRSRRRNRTRGDVKG